MSLCFLFPNLSGTSLPPLQKLTFNHHYNCGDKITPTVWMRHLNRTSNRCLVDKTVHTVCEMRLYNNRVGNGGQCKHSVVPVTTHRLAVRGCSWCGLRSLRVLTICYLFYEIQTLSIIHPVYGLPLNPLPAKTKKHTHSMYLHKHKQLETHNGCIFLHGHVMKWAMSKLLAHYTRKQLSQGETEPIPNLWQFALFDMRRPSPPSPALSAAADEKFYSQCIHHHSDLIWRNVCLFRYTKYLYLLYSSCSREKICLLKYSWSFSLA